MARTERKTRPYRSAGREAQAAQTRRRVLVAPGRGRHAAPGPERGPGPRPGVGDHVTGGVGAANPRPRLEPRRPPQCVLSSLEAALLRSPPRGRRGRLTPMRSEVGPQHDARPLVLEGAGHRAWSWRWRWDLNPRRCCHLTRFRGVLLRPLGHATAGRSYRSPRRAPHRFRGVASRRCPAKKLAAVPRSAPPAPRRRPPSVVQPAVADDVPHRARRPRFGVPGPNTSRSTRAAPCARAHRARLQRDHQRAPGQPPAAEPAAACAAQHLGVRGRVAVASRAFAARATATPSGSSRPPRPGTSPWRAPPRRPRSPLHRGPVEPRAGPRAGPRAAPEPAPARAPGQRSASSSSSSPTVSPISASTAAGSSPFSSTACAACCR
jgi:hypothetical protein